MHGTVEGDRPALVPGLPPLAFFPTHGAEQASAGSVCNAAEADRVAAIVQALLSGTRACAHPFGAGEGSRAVTVAVITPYRAQVRAVTSSMRRRGLISGGAAGCDDGSADGDDGPVAEGCLQVATVDSFQGAERDVVIVTTVKTHGSAAFIDEARRLNVTLSRPRSHLILVGSPEALTGGLNGLAHLPHVVQACTPMTLDALRSLTGADDVGAGVDVELVPGTGPRLADDSIPDAREGDDCKVPQPGHGDPRHARGEDVGACKSPPRGALSDVANVVGYE